MEAALSANQITLIVNKTSCQLKRSICLPLTRPCGLRLGSKDRSEVEKSVKHNPQNTAHQPDQILRPLLRAGTMESSSDEEEGRTFVQALCEKYNPEDFPYGQGVVVRSSPPGSPVKGET